MKKYRVTLPISVGAEKAERIYQPGDIAELDDATALAYKHALIAVTDKKVEVE